MATKQISILSDARLFPTVINTIQGSNTIDTVVYTLENYVDGERDLSTYDWYAHLIGVEGVDAVKLTSAIVDGKLQITFDLTEYITRLGNTLTYQIVAKDDVSAVWNSAKGVILNAESINADDKIVAEYPSILRQWELRIEEMAGSLDRAIYYIPYGETLPKEDRMSGRLYFKYLYEENKNGQLEDSDGNVLIPEQVAKNIGISAIDGLTAATVQEALQALKVMIENKDSLPAQAGNTGKYLRTNGETAEWADVENLPDQTGKEGKYLRTNGESYSWEDAPRGLPLLSSIWADHKLNDVSYLRADNFTWHSGDVYVAAYNHLVSDIDGKTTETETVSGVTISFYRAEDGHKIVGADQEANVASLYESTGVAWYYVIDIANKQFKLPRERCKQVVRAYDDGNVWYRLYADGWVEQGIHASITGGDAAAVTLPISMSSANYHVSLTQYNGDTSAPNLNRLSYYNQTTTGFSVVSRYTSSGVARNFVWSVCGKAAITPEQNARLYFYVGNYVRGMDEVNVGAWSELAHGVDIEATTAEINIVKEAAIAEVISAGESISSYQQPLVTLSATGGSVELVVNNVYTITITSDTSFVLPTAVDTNFFNQIKVMAKITGTPVITWGTTYFVNKEAPAIEEGHYDFYFDYDNNLGGWVLGAVNKG